jgi:hypothetical protein
MLVLCVEGSERRRKISLLANMKNIGKKFNYNSTNIFSVNELEANEN